MVNNLKQPINYSTYEELELLKKAKEAFVDDDRLCLFCGCDPSIQVSSYPNVHSGHTVLVDRLKSGKLTIVCIVCYTCRGKWQSLDLLEEPEIRRGHEGN